MCFAEMYHEQVERRKKIIWRKWYDIVMPTKPPKPSRPTKSATDVLVSDPDAALRKFQTVTRAILNAPKSEVDAIRATSKSKPKTKK